jgi:hypothetical protein
MGHNPLPETILRNPRHYFKNASHSNAATASKSSNILPTSSINNSTLKFTFKGNNIDRSMKGRNSSDEVADSVRSDDGGLDAAGDGEVKGEHDQRGNGAPSITSVNNTTTTATTTTTASTYKSDYSGLGGADSDLSRIHPKPLDPNAAGVIRLYI